jgi:hypothetical protein
MDHIRRPDLSTKGRDIDDPSPARGNHVGQHRLRDLVGAFQIDVHQAVPIGIVNLGEGCEVFDGGIVHENCNWAEMGSHLGNRHFHLRTVGDIGRDGKRFAPCRNDCIRHCRCVRSINVEHCDTASALRQSHRDGLAHASSAAGNQCGPCHPCSFGHSMVEPPSTPMVWPET